MFSGVHSIFQTVESEPAKSPAQRRDERWKRDGGGSHGGFDELKWRNNNETIIRTMGGK